MQSLQQDLGLIEGQHIELKGAFTWNTVRNSEDGELRLGTSRSVAAFANSAGGRLILGVADDGSVHGIDEEIGRLFSDNHLDRYENLLHEHLKNTLYPCPFRTYSVSFEQRPPFWICCINVRPTPGLTYVKQKTAGGAVEHVVYLRTGNRTIKVTDLDRDRMLVERFGGHWSL